MSEKTERPSHKRLQDARQKGQVAYSKELMTAVQLGVILLWLTIDGSALQAQLSGMILASINLINQPLDTALASLTTQGAHLVVRFLFRLAALLGLSLLIMGLLQTGFLFSPGALSWSLDRINPLSHVKQLFSARNFFELGKMLVEVTLLALALGYLLFHYAPSFALLPLTSLAGGMEVCRQLAQWMWEIMLAMIALLALPDYAVQFWIWYRQQRMSKEEVKQDYKDAEGNPEIKQRRLALYDEIHSGSLADTLDLTSLVLRNPTHIAICLRYDADSTPVPKVLETGCDQRALHIVALAEARGIPVVENITLARALYATTRPGDFIPGSLFAPVARVLAWLQHQVEAT